MSLIPTMKVSLNSMQRFKRSCANINCSLLIHSIYGHNSKLKSAKIPKNINFGIKIIMVICTATQLCHKYLQNFLKFCAGIHKRNIILHICVGYNEHLIINSFDLDCTKCASLILSLTTTQSILLSIYP